jgi:hypothetical protein
VAEIDLGLTVVLAIAAFFLIWYYAAFLYSRRLVGRLAKEVKDAVLRLGGTSRVQWFGTTAFRMTTEGADPPFRLVSVTVTPRPREMPINWAIGTAQGRRDVALVEASLRGDLRVGFEIVDPLTRVGRRRSRAPRKWSRVSIEGRELLLFADDEVAARRLLEDLGPGTLDPIMALHVSAGSESGIAASVSARPGEASRGLEAIRTLGERLTA